MQGIFVLNNHSFILNIGSKQILMLTYIGIYIGAFGKGRNICDLPANKSDKRLILYYMILHDKF